MKFPVFEADQSALPLGFSGPFKFNNQIVYWDTLAKKYWDPNIDQYLSDEETYQMITFINGKLTVARL